MCYIREIVIHMEQVVSDGVTISRYFYRILQVL